MIAIGREKSPVRGGMRVAHAAEHKNRAPKSAEVATTNNSCDCPWKDLDTLWSHQILASSLVPFFPDETTSAPAFVRSFVRFVWPRESGSLPPSASLADDSSRREHFTRRERTDRHRERGSICSPAITKRLDNQFNTALSYTTFPNFDFTYFCYFKLLNK